MIDIAIRPTPEQLQAWIEAYVPEKDLFFLEAEDISVLQDTLTGTLVFPRNEFFSHSSYNGIQMVNSYTYWTISKHAGFVMVAPPNWVTTLDPAKRDVLFKRQVELGRGLTGPLSHFSDLGALPQEYVIEVNGKQHVIMQRALWGTLSNEAREDLLCTIAQQYDAWDAKPIPSMLPVHLTPYANTFAATSGANCLAATLFAISTEPESEEWIINEWVHNHTFAEQLKIASFVKTEDRFEGGDVVAWVNEEGIIQHAAYCIEGSLFFNKNGQTFFNPWKIVEWTELENNWSRYTPQVYRKM
ncbi:hypothetical protein HNO89_004060 [Sporosarcina luteola]|nr:hypothetical protein [Sporosarcina luteola]